MSGLSGVATRGLLVAALVWSGGVLAHCDPADGHFECPQPDDPTPTEPVPGNVDKLVGNVLSRQALTGSGGVKLKSEVVNQRYSNNARQWYLLLDATVRLPAPALGIANKAQAQGVQLTAHYYHAGQGRAYAECTLEPRSSTASMAVYSLGLKANAAHTLLRWGHCDNPQAPGHDSVFPLAVSGDRVVLNGPGGTAIAEFEPPIVVDVPMPAKPRKLAQPATAKLLEGAAYKIKK